MRDQVITDPDEWLASEEKAEKRRKSELSDRMWSYRAYWPAIIADLGPAMVELGIFDKPSRSFYLNGMPDEDYPEGYEFCSRVVDYWQLKGGDRARYILGMNIAPGDMSIMWDLIDSADGSILYTGATACLNAMGR